MNNIKKVEVKYKIKKGEKISFNDIKIYFNTLDINDEMDFINLLISNINYDNLVWYVDLIDLLLLEVSKKKIINFLLKINVNNYDVLKLLKNELLNDNLKKLYEEKILNEGNTNIILEYYNNLDLEGKNRVLDFFRKTPIRAFSVAFEYGRFINFNYANNILPISTLKNILYESNNNNLINMYNSIEKKDILYKDDLEKTKIIKK